MVGTEHEALVHGAAKGVKHLIVQAMAEQFAIGGLPFGIISAEAEIFCLRRKRGIGLALGVASVTGPAIIAGMVNPVGADGIEFDIAITREHVVFAVDETGFVAAFPEGAAALINMVNVADIATADGLHDGADGAFALDRERGRPARTVRPGWPRSRGGISEALKIKPVILFGKKTRLAVVATLDNVLRYAGDR